MTQGNKGEVTVKYNKLHADPKQGRNLDLILKKVKHKMVENMSSQTADALGLSRAILCNDSLVKKLDELERTELMYKGLVDHTKRVLRGYFDLLMVCKGRKSEKFHNGTPLTSQLLHQEWETCSATSAYASLRRRRARPFVSLASTTG